MKLKERHLKEKIKETRKKIEKLEKEVKKSYKRLSSLEEMIDPKGEPVILFLRGKAYGEKL